MSIHDDIVRALQEVGFQVTVWPPEAGQRKDHRSPLTDDELNAVIEAARGAGGHPWTTEIRAQGEGVSGDNWQLADFGIDEKPDGSGYQQVYLVTDHVRASERVMSGGALSEATHCAVSDPETVLRMAGELLTLREMLDKEDTP